MISCDPGEDGFAAAQLAQAGCGAAAGQPQHSMSMALVERMVAIAQDRPPIRWWHPASMNTSPPPIPLATLEAVLERVTYANEGHCHINFY